MKMLRTTKHQSSGLVCGPGNKSHTLNSVLDELYINDSIKDYYQEMNFKLTETCPAIEFLMRYHNLKGDSIRILNVEEDYIYNN